MNHANLFARLLVPLNGSPSSTGRSLTAGPLQEWPLRPSSVRQKPIAKPEPTTRPTLKP